MNAFEYARPHDLTGALALMVAHPEARFIAGGTNLVDLMKEKVTQPSHLIDISRLPLAAIEPTAAGGVMLGALASNADTAFHPLVAEGYPLLAKAILAGASPQLRNMATNGGNLLQRTRCYYFYDTAFPCNKRVPGSGCPAIRGVNRMHAILGTSEHCIAAYPGDMAVALTALEAVIHVRGAAGARSIPIADLHRLPGTTPERDTELRPGEIITGVELPEKGFRDHYAYLKIRDRASYAFALVSVAAALEMDGDRIVEARLVLGGVAPKPWRNREAEAALARSSGNDAAALSRAADLMFAVARGFGHNDFKIELGRRAVVRALRQAMTMERSDDRLFHRTSTEPA